MKLRHRRSTTVIMMFFTLTSMLLAGALVFHHSSATVLADGEGQHLITVHDRGLEQSFLTEADTIEGALKENGFALDPRDTVEPALDEELVASDYQVNIYRARPVTVIDGATRQKLMTPYQTAEQIAQDAGVTLYPEDTTELVRSEDILTDGAGLQLIITRATELTIDLFGEKVPVRTQAKTVGDLLKEKSITLTADDRSSLTLDTPITAGMTVRIWREGVQTITVDEEVDFDVEQIMDGDRPVGYKEVQTTGQKGSRTVTYKINVVDGEEVSRDEIASITTTEPTTQVEVVGTKPNYLPYTGGGTKTEWLAASNVPQESWGYADFMVTRESGWNPNAINASSGACGLAQALPCSKVPGNPYNPIDSLNWMNGYVNGRYGGWQGAYNFWTANHWY